jgi:hypothetical protein
MPEVELVKATLSPRRVDLKARGQAKSRVSNGKDVLPGLRDGRGIVARRYRDISNAILADQSGVENCSESRLQLIRRFAAAAVLAEQMEAKLANGEKIDVSEHALLCSTLSRLASRIGIDRRSKDITPSLKDYIEGLPDEEAAQ